MSQDGLLSIGALATATGVTVTAIRYYDEIGLITTAGRVGGKRRFEAETIRRVSFVRRAQRVGFSLEEIADLLNDENEHWTDLVARRLHSLRAQRDELGDVIALLEGVESCGCQSVATCTRLDDPDQLRIAT